MKYEVTRSYIRTDTWYVEADTRDEAKEIASNSKVNEIVELNNTKHTGQYVVRLEADYHKRQNLILKWVGKNCGGAF